MGMNCKSKKKMNKCILHDKCLHLLLGDEAGSHQKKRKKHKRSLLMTSLESA